MEIQYVINLLFIIALLRPPFCRGGRCARGQAPDPALVPFLKSRPRGRDQRWAERAAKTGARILVPTGALIGLDAVRAAAEGEIGAVKLVSRKPPSGLLGAPYLAARGITLAGLTEPLKLFGGSAREGVRGFPANVNVAAALALAGIGPDRTRLEIWADPNISRNIHRIEVEAELMLIAVDGFQWVEDQLATDNIVTFIKMCNLAMYWPREDIAKLLDKKFGPQKWQQRYQNHLKGNTDIWSQRVIDAVDRRMKILA